jgi:hypothetical protein
MYAGMCLQLEQGAAVVEESMEIMVSIAMLIKYISLVKYSVFTLRTGQLLRTAP